MNLLFQELAKQGISETRLKLKRERCFCTWCPYDFDDIKWSCKDHFDGCFAGTRIGGYIAGEITISGYPKVQQTFSRIAGYVEQNDIHSHHLIVEESLWFSQH